MRLTPDGHRYLAMADQQGPAQFRLRWLIPAVCGRNIRAWVTVTYMSLAVSTVLCGVLVWQHTGSLARAVAAAGLFAGLPMVRFLSTAPVLVDAPGVALALLSAVAMGEGWWPLAVAAALLAGCTRETAPVFAALFAWHPLPLVGMLPVAIRYATSRPGRDVLDAHNRWVLDHPRQASKLYHRGQWTSPKVMLLPWGGCLAALVHPNPWLVGTVVVAYLQVLIATDTVRLYQWAAPVVAAAAVLLPVPLLPVLVLAHWFNPWAGNGV